MRGFPSTNSGSKNDTGKSAPGFYIHRMKGAMDGAPDFVGNRVAWPLFGFRSRGVETAVDEGAEVPAVEVFVGNSPVV
jgi:hypothetical protein